MENPKENYRSQAEAIEIKLRDTEKTIASFKEMIREQLEKIKNFDIASDKRNGELKANIDKFNENVSTELKEISSIIQVIQDRLQSKN